MDAKELGELLQQNGIVGAGGAGFPTYAKINEKVHIIIMNCAECEPLLKLHRQLLQYHAEEILETFHMIAGVLKVDKAVIGIKKEFKSTLQELKNRITKFPEISLHLLDDRYPMGDEVVLIYETTGKVIRPGGLPIEAGVAVFNVETVYNIYRAWRKNVPVIDKLVTVAGEVEHPITVRVPIGSSLEEVVALAGEKEEEQNVYLVGGPMMGRILPNTSPITKTTNAILVLPKNHYIIQRKRSNASIDIKRAASICCQCQTCTDLCPRYELGHPIEPHKFMRAVSNKDFQDINIFINTMFCSGCGVCELYSCPQMLSPRTLISEYKNGLRLAGVKVPQNVKLNPVNSAREYKKVPEERLMARLGLSKYDKDAPFYEETKEMGVVKILLGQHIGAPSVPVVTVGEVVQKGQLIGKANKGLSVNLHASIEGKIIEVTESYIAIRKIG